MRSESEGKNLVISVKVHFPLDLRQNALCGQNALRFRWKKVNKWLCLWFQYLPFELDGTSTLWFRSQKQFWFWGQEHCNFRKWALSSGSECKLHSEGHIRFRWRQQHVIYFLIIIFRKSYDKLLNHQIGITLWSSRTSKSSLA